MSNYWTKFDTGYWETCANAGLSDAAHLTHDQAFGFLFRLGDDDLVISTAMLRRFATTEDPWKAAAELVAAGFWCDHELGWRIVHNSDEARESMASQKHAKNRSRKSSKAARDRSRARSRDRS